MKVVATCRRREKSLGSSDRPPPSLPPSLPNHNEVWILRKGMWKNSHPHELVVFCFGRNLPPSLTSQTWVSLLSVQSSEYPRLRKGSGVSSLIFREGGPLPPSPLLPPPNPNSSAADLQLETLAGGAATTSHPPQPPHIRPQTCSQHCHSVHLSATFPSLLNLQSYPPPTANAPWEQEDHPATCHKRNINPIFPLSCHPIYDKKPARRPPQQQRPLQ